MKKYRISIKNRLHFSSIGILIILLAMGVVIKYATTSFSENHDLLTKVKELNKNDLVLQKVEKEFMLKETINPEFYETGISSYAREFESVVHEMEKQIESARDYALVRNNQLHTKLDSINESLNIYSYTFEQLVQLARTKGFKDFGMVGQMREIIHDVEDKVKQARDLQGNIYLLTLRRHEKDYLLRKDLKYRERFGTVIEEYTAYLDSKNLGIQALDLTNALKEYESIFYKVIDKDKQIGLAGGGGILERLNKQSDHVETRVKHLHQEILEKSQARIKEAMLLMFGAIAVFSILILLILRRISKEIVTSLTKLKNHVGRLGRGELPDRIKIRYRNEISDMIHDINILTDNLKNTRAFALEVGKGNLETNINVFNNQGDLGGSLIEMRNQLLQVSKERERQQEENEQRNWINEGIARLSSITRSQMNDLKELCYEFISTLVKYMDANQAGIFLLDETSSDEVYFELMAAYAYDRRKFANNRVKLGEGLVGTCAIEKEYIYMSEIPDEYINITSGLGDAPPRNLILMPLKHNDDVLGVFEIASFKAIPSYQLDFLKLIAEDFALTIGNARINRYTTELLQKSELQAKELQGQEEELRQNLEELKATEEEMIRKEKSLEEKISLLESEKNQTESALINELKRIRREKNKAAQLLELINESVLVGELNVNEEFISANKKFMEILGYDEHELDGCSIKDIIPEQEHPEFEKIWKEVLRGETKSRIGKRIKKDLQSIWLKITYTPVKNNAGLTEKVLFIAKEINHEPSKKELNTSNIHETTNKLKEELHYFIELQNNYGAEPEFISPS